MWGIVEKVVLNQIYVIFENRTSKMYINDKNLKIVENDQVEIIDNKIVNVKGYNEELYLEIRQLQEKIKKNIN